MSHRAVREAGFGAGDFSKQRYPRAFRALDICLVLLALPIVLPIALLISLGIILDSPGPLLHRVRRVGKDGNTFEMLKFRTMALGSDGPPLRAPGDRRMTPLGHTLSRTRLNELPQLWNVLRGDMRLIGPRPEAPEFVKTNPAAFAEVLAVPPGVTGPAQLHFIDEAQLLALVPAERHVEVYTREILPQKLALDLEFVRRGQRLSDLALLGLTFLRLAAVRGRAADASVSRSTALVAIGAAAFFALFLIEVALI